MASHLDLEEQEQLAELKHFWSRWGNLISWVVIAVLAGYAAWTGWQYWSNRQGAQAAVLYDTVERAAAAGDMAMLERSATDIEDKFASTTYAHQSALLAARVMFERGNAASARKQLQWVLDHGSDEAYIALARLRLSGLLIQDNALDDARKVLAAKAPAEFEPLLADRLGDIDMLQNKPQDAVTNYQKAWRGMEANSEYRRLVAVKLSALGKDPEELSASEKK
jgi:predicted negative regulator of RcsB-dependent stress response